jgi:hypothetical protein
MMEDDDAARAANLVASADLESSCRFGPESRLPSSSAVADMHAAYPASMSSTDSTPQEWHFISMAIDSFMSSTVLSSSLAPIVRQLVERIKSLKNQVEPLVICEEQVSEHQGSDLQERISQFQWEPSLQHCHSDWSLQGCRSSCSHIPELISQLESECTYQINHSFASLQSCRWGLGTAENASLMPGLFEWFNESHVNQCISALRIVRNDVYFLSCYALDQLLHNRAPSDCFLVEARKMKLSYVACIFSPKQDKNKPRNFLFSDERGTVLRNDGYHWIVFLADLDHNDAWVYDPSSVILQGTLYDTEFHAFQRFVDLLRGNKSRGLNRIQCPFLTKCQIEGIHCGLWCSMYMIAWCLGPEALRSYDNLCRSQQVIPNGLPALALQFRGRLSTDIVRHQLLDVTFLHLWKSPPATDRDKNSFWIDTPLHICAQLQIKYGSRFTEVEPTKNGNWNARPPTSKCGSTFVKNPMFFRDGIRCVKVYRFLWGKVDLGLLAIALHEAAATAFVCPRMGWNHEVFGVFTTGVCANYVHICICRDELNVATSNPNQFAQEIIKLLNETGVVHGDGHSLNVLLAKFRSVFEVIDFERSFIPNSTCSSQSVEKSILDYGTANDDDRARILKWYKAQGLHRTRTNFESMATAVMSSPSDKNLFDCGIDDFIAVFKLTS